VVEDQPDIAELRSAQLRRAGYRVRLASDGHPALARLDEAGADFHIRQALHLTLGDYGFGERRAAMQGAPVAFPAGILDRRHEVVVRSCRFAGRAPHVLALMFADPGSAHTLLPPSSLDTHEFEPAPIWPPACWLSWRTAAFPRG
jgi:CheY-like chemotaxis protein